VHHVRHKANGGKTSVKIVFYFAGSTTKS